jgi:hypothetical protein
MKEAQQYPSLQKKRGKIKIQGNLCTLYEPSKRSRAKTSGGFTQT